MNSLQEKKKSKERNLKERPKYKSRKTLKLPSKKPKFLLKRNNKKLKPKRDNSKSKTPNHGWMKPRNN